MAKAPVTIEERKTPIIPIAEKAPLNTPVPPVSIAGKSVVQPLPPVEIFEKSTIKLNREIYSLKGFNQTVGIEFEEFTKKEDNFSPEQFFQLYNSLFFEIPKLGENSHVSLIRRSKEYVGNFNINDPKDNVIDSLNNRIIELEEELLLANQTDPEHPFFKNGTIVGKLNSSDAYYMDKGFKRKINYTEDFWRVLIKVLGYNPSDYPDGPGWFPSTSQQILSQIPTGPNLDESNFEQPTTIENGELIIGTSITSNTKDAQINNLRSQVNQLNTTIDNLRDQLRELDIPLDDEDNSIVGRNNVNEQINNNGLLDKNFGGQGNFNDPLK